MRFVSRSNEFNADSHGEIQALCMWKVEKSAQDVATRRSKGETVFDRLANSGLYSSLHIHRPVRKALQNWIPDFMSQALLATVDSCFFPLILPLLN